MFSCSEVFQFRIEKSSHFKTDHLSCPRTILIFDKEGVIEILLFRSSAKSQNQLFNFLPRSNRMPLSGTLARFARIGVHPSTNNNSDPFFYQINAMDSGIDFDLMGVSRNRLFLQK